jgi:hypothetical protein
MPTYQVNEIRNLSTTYTTYVLEVVVDQPKMTHHFLNAK